MKEYTMKEGNIYTKIRDFSPRTKSRWAKSVYHCSKCSVNDPELWYEGSIVHYDYRVKKGISSCGCSSRVIYKERQFKTLIKRKCKDLGYKFLSFNLDDGCSIGKKTKLNLYNPKTDNYWGSTTIETFLADRAKDPCLRSEGINRKDDNLMISKFMDTGKYHKETKFQRNLNRMNSQGRKSFWDVVCGKCGEEYTSCITQLKSGKVGCSCKKGGGFDNNKDGRVYVCLWYNNDVKYLKFGITNMSVTGRIKDQYGRSSNLEHKLLFKSEYKEGYRIRELENRLKDIYRHQLSACPKTLLPDGYTETILYSEENLLDILLLIEDYFKNF
ncbi:endonuclease [Vibrio phage PWH3a-P1]|uniref:endonuclease n=1 Tax=Vibrio phage PWH3a-P1 TaxID=754058 RepID=UPI0002C0B2E5|nr:endonuclease [Vibrio phage PWH3a-P1]AGH31936.1 hypothetical protein VPIG_00078 [Vibrio phage PWH3a-P1]